jgi:hypothetical protein
VPLRFPDVAVIGDQYVDDGVYPAHFGFLSVWFTGVRRGASVNCGITPTAEVNDLAELSDLLASPLNAPQCRRASTGRACSNCQGPVAPGERCCFLCQCLRGWVSPDRTAMTSADFE